MASESGAEMKMRLKLMINKKTNKVIFAEAGNDFVNLIFHIMSMPLASIVKLLNEKGKEGGNILALYRSIYSLNAECFNPNLSKDSILRPKAALSVHFFSFVDVPIGFKVFWCDNNHYITDKNNGFCPVCSPFRKLKEVLGKDMLPALRDTNKNNYLRGGQNYMVMDNMEVKPMSISLVMSLVIDFDYVEEREVQVGHQEGLAILKAFMENQDVFTSVFLPKKMKMEAN